MLAPSLNRVEIDLAALQYNYTVIQALVGSQVKVMAMVKADAYGHGLIPAAKAFYEAGARIFGVAEVEEGVRLRENGLAGDILVLLGVTAESVADIIQYGLTPVIFDVDAAAELSAAAVKAHTRVPVHLKVDVGMGRLGIMPEQVAPSIEALSRLPGIVLRGLFSHFPLADVSDEATLAQWEHFTDIVKKVNETVTPDLRLVHIANSAALLRLPQTHFDVVRPGITLYGCYPADDRDYCQILKIKPVMAFKTKVVQVKDLPKGHGISYGHRYVTDRPTRIAVLPVGYDDGYIRRLTGKAQVLIHGRRAPVRGTICMNLCIADVTEIEDVQVGDDVVLMGRQGDEEITADEIASWLDTISYEVLCLFGRSNRHVYME